ncbi:MAG: GvpL/GvpF family gas vesicle protein [Terrabacter sp.]
MTTSGEPHEAAQSMDGADPAGAGRYLYAVCRGLPAGALAQVQGIEGHTVELVQYEDLVAVVSTVPMASFGEAALRRNLEDLGWLEATVRAHDAVVHAASGWAPTAPLRFATVCFDDDAVLDRMREWYEPLTTALDRVEGCSEWSVKVLVRPDAPATAGRSGLSGAEYLRRKKAETLRRADADEQAAAAAGAIHERLAQRSRASRRLQPQDPRLSGHQGTMVLNAAYLVHDDDRDAFEAELAAVGEPRPDLALDARGPWPPYSFAMLDDL